ncbi:MAG: YdcF family protein [Clostridiales Family XIII bacterium]|jgi:vancomycin permeability regulator SanA|nr:YdcF family protein [Clostridiales Family XIII bacterium]
MFMFDDEKNARTKERANQKRKNKEKKEKAPKFRKEKGGARKFVAAFFGVCVGLVLIAGLVVAATNIYMIKTVEDQIVTVDEAAALRKAGNDFQCVEVLGASIRNGKPSSILAKRINTGLAAYAAGVSDILLFSGDNGTNEYNEVTSMRAYAFLQSAYQLDEDAVFLDYAGFSTYESMYRLRDVFQATDAVVVTQEYHLYRALYVADQLGVNVYGIAAPAQEEGQFFRDVREVLARTKDFFYVLFDIQPTYLGDPVELTKST